MNHLPDAAVTEAADNAALRVLKAIGTMEGVDLGLKVSPEAKNTNSADSEFLDYLMNGGHLKEGFLAHAK